MVTFIFTFDPRPGHGQVIKGQPLNPIFFLSDARLSSLVLPQDSKISFVVIYAIKNGKNAIKVVSSMLSALTAAQFKIKISL